ncbi:hypothetical protein P872_08585 [Rhodonellum psychrophilum GCM71 = DSM 17998]|uniref:Uncharacterized protein n=1 Tax=Rhodonellum psychrophilum GCM71 = DSM 17998 TaxID=1123057 RepID=U5BNA7_9BACT|nr:hypothetical protein P872_08585 [Rhodonellum psychrophilum GCM71 = DSM 17998]
MIPLDLKCAIFKSNGTDQTYPLPKYQYPNSEPDLMGFQDF